MPLIGYARVSTEEQTLGSQPDALRAAGCGEVFEEFASGASRSRPQLAAALTRVRRGDTLVVARIDRLVRSLSHLLAVSKGAFPIACRPDRQRGPALCSSCRCWARWPNSSAAASSASAPRLACRPPKRADGWVAIQACARDPAVLRKLAASRRASRLAGLLPDLH